MAVQTQAMVLNGVTFILPTGYKTVQDWIETLVLNNKFLAREKANCKKVARIAWCDKIIDQNNQNIAAYNEAVKV